MPASNPDRTWELRRDFARLEQAIHAFLDKDRPCLMRVELADRGGTRHRPLAGVIFCVREWYYNLTFYVSRFTFHALRLQDLDLPVHDLYFRVVGLDPIRTAWT